MRSLTNTLKALSDETRLRMVNLLYEKELCVCDITEALQITQTKASRHLNYLKNAELAADRKQAQWVYYSLTDSLDRKLIETLILDYARKLDLYQNDLESLGQWLERKSMSCT